MMVILKLTGQQSFEMAFVEYDHRVQAVASNAADEPFHEGILLRRLRCGEHFFDPPMYYPLLDVGAEDGIAVTKQVARGRVPGERFDDLLRGPLLRGMFCDVKVHHPAPLMGEDDEDKEYLEIHGGHHEEVDGNPFADMVFQKRFPGR